MLINYFHDLSVAMLASNIIVVYLFARYLETHPDKAETIGNIFSRLSKVTYWALAYVLLGGAVRAYYFMDFEWNPAVGRGQVAALVVKHIILVGLTIFGIITHRRYVRKYGRA
jgi:hypothetical protein